MIKKITIIVFFIVLFVIPVSAEESSDYEFYKQEFDVIGGNEINNTLPDKAREYITENKIDPSDYNWVNSLTSKNVFTHIFEFIKSGAKSPLKAGAGILGIILITAALNCCDFKSSAVNAAMYASTAATAAIIAVPVFSAITSSVDAMNGSAVFMLSFIPIFAVVVSASGAAVTSVSMSALLLTASQGVSYISNFIVIPLMSGYLALSLSSSVSPLIKNSGLAESIKKISFWIISFITTIFLGILSIQTAVNASADNLTMKTAKFIIGSSIPVAGTALSEALTTVTASMSLLKASIGIYGVIACCAIFIPLIVELLLWRLVLLVTSSASDLFSLTKISTLLKAIDSMMSIMIGIILLTGAMFIISLTIVVTAGKG